MKLDMLKGPQTPPLYDTLMGVKQNVMRSLRVCVPGNVVAFYPSDRTVDVQVALLQQNSNGSSTPYPQLLGCPVITLQGGGVVLGMPIEVGDECLVFFADRCLDAWFQSGTPQVLPNFRMHDLSDGFALVGVNSLANAMDSALQTGEGGLADNQARVAILAGKIAISNNLEALATLLLNLIATLTTIATVPGGGPLNAASITALTTYIARINNLLIP